MSNEVHDWVGGGNIAAILKISPLQTPLQAYLGIIGEADPFDAAKLRFFNRRKRVEDYVIPILEEEEGLKIVGRNVRYLDKKFPWMRTEIDAEDELAGGIIRNIEIKSVNQFAARPWGMAGSDEGVPPYVLAQIMLGLSVTDRDEALAVGQIGFDDNRPYPVKRDDALISMIREQAEEFWIVHVVPRVPPPPINLDDASRLWPKSMVKSMLATPGMLDRLRQMAALDVELKALTEKKDAHKLEVQKEMGEHDTLISTDGKVAASWRNNKNSIKLDKDGLIDEYEAELRQHLLLGGTAWIEAKRKARTTESLGARPFLNKAR